MKSKGNGKPELCALNLAKLKRGEVFYDRLRGLRTSVIDAPYPTVEGKMEEDLSWALTRWEPRIGLSDLTLQGGQIMEGDFEGVLTLERKNKNE